MWQGGNTKFNTSNQKNNLYLDINAFSQNVFHRVCGSGHDAVRARIKFKKHYTSNGEKNFINKIQPSYPSK